MTGKSIFSKSMLCLLLVVFIALTGCAGSDKPSSGAQSKGTENNNEPKEITLWHGAGDEALQALAKAFEAKHPEYKVKLVFVADQRAGSGQKLLSSIAGGTPPDLAYFDRFQIGSWAAQGSLTDLTDRASKDGISADKFYPFAWNETMYKDRLFGLPISTDARLLYYNKDHFKAAGLDPENPPKTIQELEEAAAKLTVKEGKRFKQIGFVPWYSQGFLYTWGWVFGGEYYDNNIGKVTANDPKIVDALQWLVDYGKKYGVENITSFTDSAGKGEMAPFLTGQLSMEIATNEMQANIQKFKPDLNFGVAPIPTPTGSNFTSWSGGWSLVIPKGAKEADGAWEFMKFSVTEEGQKIFNKVYSTLSVVPEVNEVLGYTQDPIMNAFINILPESHNRPVITQGALLWNEMKQVTSSALFGKGTPEQLLNEAAEKVNNELAKDTKK